MKSILQRYPHSIMAAVLLLFGIGSILFGERMTAHDGQGWDGQFYVGLVRGFPDIFVNRMDSYHTQRIIPSGILHYTMTWLGLPMDTFSIITAFQIYNLILLLICLRLWKGIGDELGISGRGRWLGFIGLFLSFAVLKMGFYYPNLTDVSAFTLSMALLYFYLRRSLWGVVAITLIGAFTWPTFLFGGVLLLLFPRIGSGGEERTAPHSEKRSLFGLRPNLLVAGGGALAVAGFIFVFHFIKEREYFGWGTVPIVEELYHLSVLLMVGYVFWLLYVLLDGITFQQIFARIRAIRPAHIAAAVITFAVAYGMYVMITDFDKKAYGALIILKTTILLSITRPLLFIVPHIMYFGPILLLAILLWRPATRLMQKHGLGIILFVLLNLPMALNAESRRSAVLVPVIVIFTVVAADALNWRRWHLWTLAGIALIFSKVWYPINQGSLEGEMIEFPAQHFFMNAGPWTANGPYVIQVAAAVLAGGLLWWMVRQGRTVEVEEFHHASAPLLSEGEATA